MPEKPRRSRLQRMAWTLIYLMGAWLVGHFYLHFNTDFSAEFQQFPPTEFAQMVDESGSRPYVGRMLVPMIVGASVAATPKWLQQAETWILMNSEFNTDFAHSDWVGPRRFPFAITYLYFLSLATFFGIAIGARKTYQAIYSDSGFLSNLAGLFFLLAVPLWFHGVSFFYDPMTILLNVWILYSLYKRSVWLTCVLFILAMLNKETSLFLIPVILFALFRNYKETKKKDDLYYIVLSAVLLVVSSALIQIYRINHFAQNPGTWMENHWADAQMKILSKYPMTTLHETLVLGIMLAFSFVDWKRKPALLRIGTICVFVPLFVSSIVVGRVFEIRALYDAYPILGMLAIPTLLKCLLGEESISMQPARLDQAVSPSASHTN